MKVTALIMAGGKGERFWPRSRQDFPKQFLSLTEGGPTLIQSTVNRLLPKISIDHIFVVTNSDYSNLVQQQLPQLPLGNIIVEPVGRNTAPCIALSASIIEKSVGESIMIVLPSDHVIHQERIYLDTLDEAIQIALQDHLVTIGITPTYPETGYGYLKYSRFESTDQLKTIYKVDQFVEKPDFATAQKYIESGDYLWNSGMFVWKTSVILRNFAEFLPDIKSIIDKIIRTFGQEVYLSNLNDAYHEVPSISIDYGIMEKADNIYTIPSSFGWDDVGSWLALERILESDKDFNSIEGNVVAFDSKHSILIGKDKLIATVGVQDLVVIDTEDALLICHRESTQDIKKLLEILKKEKPKYL